MAILRGMDRIRAHPGLQAHIARALGITRAAVCHWRRVPAERVLAVEHATGIPRHELRPDIFPHPALDPLVSRKSRHLSTITHSRKRKEANSVPAS